MAISLTKRAVKGSPLTHSEVDQNWNDIETLSNANESGITALQTSVDAVTSTDSNLLINGVMDIWQRGTSFTGLTGATDALIADRFRYSSSGTLSSVVTVERSTTIPTSTQAGLSIKYSMKASVTTADATVPAGTSLSLRYAQEGYDYAQVRGNTYTLSFWVRSSKVGTYCVSFRNNGSDRSYVAEYTINAPNTWEKKIITVAFDYSGGTDNFDNGLGLRIDFVLTSASAFHTSAGAWQSGNFIATSSQVNWADSTSNDFHLTLVKFEEGSTATRFLKRTVAQEITLCQRYFEKSYNLDVTPGTVTSIGSYSYISPVNSSLMFGLSVPFKVTKRAVPTMIAYSTATGASGMMRNDTDTADVTVSSFGNTSEGRSGHPQLSAAVLEKIISGQWTADAEL